MESLNYNHLRYFWAIGRRGSLTQASRDLHLTPQTVSTQIQLLEDHLNVKLFNRTGRRLVLTEAGQIAFQFADEIFSLGQELADTLRGKVAGRSLRLFIGIADVIPKLVSERLIAPALALDETVRVMCRETDTKALLAELAVDRLDVVITDSQIPPTVRIRAFNHKLGECGVSFMVAERHANRYRRDFPRSLDNAPFLLPTDDTVLRHSLDRWFFKRAIRPQIIGEFQDSALLKAFGQTGTGVFAVPSVIEDEVRRQYKTQPIGVADGIVETFYAVSVERSIKHPAVAAICESARTDLFA